MSDQQDSQLPEHADHQSGAQIKMRRREDGGATVEFADGSDDLDVSRREFMRISGVAAASAAMAGANCRYPKEEVVPYLDRPDDIEPGEATYFTSVCNGCSANCGIVAETRSGRPIKLKGNPDHPVNEGSLCARGEASYRRLYDPDRAEEPKSIDGGTPSSTNWNDLDKAVADRLADGASVRVLTRNTGGRASLGLLEEIAASYGDVEHYQWEPLTSEAVKRAAERCYGDRHVPQYHFDRARVIVSLGSNFLGTWLSETEFTGQWAEHRDPDEEMSRLVAFEGHLTLTGANADDRYRVPTSELTDVALALAHQVVLEHEQGPFDPSGDIGTALEPFDAESVGRALDLPAEVITSTADELVDHAGHGLVVAGLGGSSGPDGVALEVAVNILNAALGNIGETVDHAHPTLQDEGSWSDLRALADEARAGDVDVLIVDGANPVYAAPPELEFDKALENVSLVVSTSDRIDETTRKADYLAPGSHYLESWGDAEPKPGVHSIQQPVVQPLYDTRSFEESLMRWFGAGGAVGSLTSYLKAPEAPTGNVNQNVPHDAGPWYRYLRDYWKSEIYANADIGADFEQFWEDVLRTGVWETDADDAPQPSFDAGSAVAELPDSPPEPSDSTPGDLSSKELHLFASVPMYDGRSANSGHLQELPHRISKHAWGSYVLVSPRTFHGADLEQGDVLEISPGDGDQTLEFPVVMQPGLHDDVVALPLGYGRTDAGVVGSDLGENAFAFSRDGDSHQVLAGLDASLTPTGENREVSVVQGTQVIDLEQRPVLGTTTKDEYDHDPSAGKFNHEKGQVFWDAHDYDLKWGMSIDLSTCTGCGACMTACQEENNIPVVGRQGVVENREMHWIRIDRYYRLPFQDENPELHEQRGDLGDDPMHGEHPTVSFAAEYPDEFDNPQVLMQPMLCQHCENAPCETVCPVAATTHSEDGLNQMAYNRCVGTRYCSNNCPYKVRRFNWYNYSRDRSDSLFAKISPEMKEHGRLNVEEPLDLAFNPDVTVRSRGVMEKCTFCVQRIRRAKWQKQQENRDYFREDDVVTACEEACPAGSIDFGAIVQNPQDDQAADPPTHTVEEDRKDPRALRALNHLNTTPSISYLTDVRNADSLEPGVDPDAGNEPSGGHGGGHGGGGDGDTKGGSHGTETGQEHG